MDTKLTVLLANADAERPWFCAGRTAPIGRTLRLAMGRLIASPEIMTTSIWTPNGAAAPLEVTADIFESVRRGLGITECPDQVLIAQLFEQGELWIENDGKQRRHMRLVDAIDDISSRLDHFTAFIWRPMSDAAGEARIHSDQIVRLAKHLARMRSQHWDGSSAPATA